MDFNIEETEYIGIYVQYESGTYWICDDNGGSMHFGKVKPTTEQVREYRNAVCKSWV